MEVDSSSPDALLLLRSAAAVDKPPIPTVIPDPVKPDEVEHDLAKATHLQFNHSGHQSLPLDTLTRFELSGATVDLRSVYFARLNKDAPAGEYVSATARLNQDLASAGKKEIVQLPFVEKLELNAYIDGASDTSEYIHPLAAEEQARQAAAASALGAGAGVPVQGGGQGRGRQVDPRLQEIYNGERKMGDRNTMLRGTKPTDFTSVLKQAQQFVDRNKKQGKSATPAAGSNTTSSIPANSAMLTNRTKPNRRVDPIILVSPSASSLLRLSNIKSFLDEGVFHPPEAGSIEANRLQITRRLPNIDSHRDLRFILVDSPDMFKPDYWSRVAAVFTTGQTWQFKSYKWQQPPDLFSHALGIYVGYRGDEVPPVVKSWGRGVFKAEIDKYQGPAQNRWKDREEVEKIWKAVEDSMLNKGMNRDGMLTGSR